MTLKIETILDVTFPSLSLFIVNYRHLYIGKKNKKGLVLFFVFVNIFSVSRKKKKHAELVDEKSLDKTRFSCR